MLTTTPSSAPDDPNRSQAPRCLASQLDYAIGHVFLPAYRGYTLPKRSVEDDGFFASLVYATAVEYCKTVDGPLEPRWRSIVKMLSILRAFLQHDLTAERLSSELREMQRGDVLLFATQAQDAAVIFTKQDHYTLYEAFRSAGLTLRRECAIEIPDEVFCNQYFQLALANFLLRLDGFPKHECFSDVATSELSRLLTSILRSVGRSTKVPCITRPIRSHYKLGFESRSVLWLLIKLAIQMTLHSAPESGCRKYFMLRLTCDLAKEAIDVGLSSDLLYAILSKILRRFCKLALSASDALYDIVMTTCRTLRQTLEDRWKEVVQLPSLCLKLPQLDLDADTILSLTQYKEYVSYARPKNHRLPFLPKHLPRGTLEVFLSSNGSFFEKAFRVNSRITLYDFEQAVEEGIDDWVAYATDVDQACIQLTVMMENYMLMARRTYKNNPERLSVMHLTVVELWVALDKLAIEAFPLLAEFSPEIQLESLHNLLLYRRMNLRRLCCVYQYILLRYSRSVPGLSLLSTDVTNYFFPDRPVPENMPDSPGFRRLVKICGIPSLDNSFGSKCPPFLRTWHRGTKYLCSISEHDLAYRLSSSSILEVYIKTTDHTSNDILAHQAKCPRDLSQQEFIAFGHLRSGGLLQWLNILRDLRGSTLNYRRHDVYFLLAQAVSQVGPFNPNTVELLWHQELRNTSFCHVLLSELEGLLDGPSKWLDAVVLGTISLLLTRLVASNSCKKVEEECIGLLLRVRKETFCVVKGLLSNWMSVLNNVEERILLRNMAAVCWSTFDIGPDVIQKVLCSAEDVHVLLSCIILMRIVNSPIEIEEVYEHLQGLDPQSVYWMGICEFFRRYDSEEIFEMFCEHDPSGIHWFLSRLGAGEICQYLHELEFGSSCEDLCQLSPEQVDEYLKRLDETVLSKMLNRLDSGRISKYLRELNPENDSEYFYKLLLERNSRFLVAIESIFRDAILAEESCQGIDVAIHNIWSGYLPGSRGWQPLPRPNSHWLTCETASDESGCTRKIHLNLLDGMLVVDGKPIDGVPFEIRKHSEYNRIFGDQAFPVVASGLPGMEYCILGLISNHQVHIAMQNHNLVIQAKLNDMADILELIPQGQLQDDLPTALFYEHVHWLNKSNSEIEIRPLKRKWEQSSANWRIDYESGHYRARNGNEMLVDTHSLTCKMILSRLGCLDDPKNLFITTSPTDSPDPPRSRQLSAALPRYCLSFFVNENGELESRNFKNMVYDENQCIGTLFGLKNKLVLRSKAHVNREAELIPRCIIIPEGPLSREKYNYHFRVTIGIDGPITHPVPYHIYHVDTELRRLASCANWKSKLYLARLHAETSIDWMPDSLTGRTGVEEALHLLRSAGCRSILELDIRGKSEVPFFHDKQQLYPQIRFAVEEIQYLMKRQDYLCNRVSDAPQRTGPITNDVMSWRSAYLFPFEPIYGPTLPVLNTDPPGFSEPEELAYVISLAVYHWFVRVEDDSRDDYGLMNTSVQVTESAWPDLCSVPSWIAQVGAFLQAGMQLPFQPNSDDESPSITHVEELLQESTGTRQRFRLLFLLPAVAYAQRDPQSSFLSMLVALAKRQPKSPHRYSEYQPLNGYRPSTRAIMNCFPNEYYGYLKNTFYLESLLETWESDQNIKLLVSKEDPLYRAKRRYPVRGSVTEVEGFNTNLRMLFSTCYPNAKLKKRLTARLAELDKTKNRTSSNPMEFSPSVRRWSPCRLSRQLPGPPFRPLSSMPWQISLDQLLHVLPPSKLPKPSPFQRYSSDANGLDTCKLNELLDSFQFSKTDSLPFQGKYISALRASTQRLREARVLGTATKRPIEQLEGHYRECRRMYTQGFIETEKALRPKKDTIEYVLHKSGQWPRITPDTLFQCLRSKSQIKISDEWKECLLSLAGLLIEIQRTRRLLRFNLDDLEEEFWRELKNGSCENWAEDFPDWLLIQLQGNFLIREIQVDVAKSMISPTSNRNIAIQLSMGEGKSSVVVPISATALANGSQLVRVIVPKALTVQMFRQLVDRLGGLADRPIYHIPLSRSLAGGYDKEKIDLLRNLLSECVQNRGILVLQPEQILSTKLTAVEAQLEKHPNSNSMLELQRWLDHYSRDILDEVDEVLHPRFQLVYTIGDQRHIEGHPDRWTITQQVLRLVKKRAVSPLEIKYGSPPGSFPRVRIVRELDDQAREGFASSIVRGVMDGQVPCLRLQEVDRYAGLREKVQHFISSKQVSPLDARMVQVYAQKINIWEEVLLLRGLLACGILLFALAERRWRVDYGLAPNRTMLAVPFRAKDTPAPVAEFGHPDIMILLTCLSYYYGGLTEEQLRVSFKLLQELDNPSEEFASWFQDHDPNMVPGFIRDIKNVNVESFEQWRKYLFPLFSRSQRTVDFYLSRIVFPKEAKEYPWKISASSWDLAENRNHAVTGFSGTNDGQYLLPTSITQHDPDHQLGTNATILSYLLHESNVYESTSHTDTLQLLEIVVEQQPKIRVLLDVGAQILDLSNYHVAEAWLNLDSDSDGAIYFNDDDELTVLEKDGNQRSLLSSPLSQRLDRCVVYLDDAHTRGTDLKFPSGLRAATTLGPKLTKDRLAQGCMRMRKLGHGHSIMFFAPVEVDQNIRTLVGKLDRNIDVTTMDVLRWTIHESLKDIQRRAPYWAQQGIDHKSRSDSWSSFCNTSRAFRFSKQKMLENGWRRPEIKPLADLYGPSLPENAPGNLYNSRDHPNIQRCIELGVVKIPKEGIEEEQEREVNREIEQERVYLWRKPTAEAAEHSIHPGVVEFVKTGQIHPLYTNTFHPVFTALRRTSAKMHVWSPFVLATSDFCTTIKPGPQIDQFQRHVQWVLSGRIYHNRVLVLLSPFEANRLMPDIRASKHVHLHLYIPHTSKHMKPADDLKFYSIPPVPDDWEPPWDLLTQLNLFAGQLYFRDYDSYVVSWKRTTGDWQ